MKTDRQITNRLNVDAILIKRAAGDVCSPVASTCHMPANHSAMPARDPWESYILRCTFTALSINYSALHAENQLNGRVYIYLARLSKIFS